MGRLPNRPRRVDPPNQCPGRPLCDDHPRPEAEQERTARQIASLEAIVAAIVEGSELTSTDDEHDPEGATIAYERAQVNGKDLMFGMFGEVERPGVIRLGDEVRVLA